MGDSGPPVRILSLDGGGVRGLAEIIILERIMDGINVDRDENDQLEPWQVFDLIGGTSTGGIIAVMLGRLRMSLKDCKKAYLELSKKIFTPRRSGFNRLRALNVLQVNGRFDAEVLKEAMVEIIARFENEDADALLKDQRPQCKVFVVTTVKNDARTVLLRSYKNRKQSEQFYNQCKIWEACRATSAATKFFDPIKIGEYNQMFIDGGVGCNNPMQELESEASDIFPGRQVFMVSIGTGCAPNTGFGNDAILSIIEGMKAIVTQTERTADAFLRAHSDRVRNGLLFRFNVSQGLKEIGLEEYKEIDNIAGATQTYLRDFETGEKLRWCTDRLIEFVLEDPPDRRLVRVESSTNHAQIHNEPPRVIPELQSRFESWNTHKDQYHIPGNLPSPAASPAFTVDGGVHSPMSSRSQSDRLLPVSFPSFGNEPPHTPLSPSGFVPDPGLHTYSTPPDWNSQPTPAPSGYHTGSLIPLAPPIAFPMENQYTKSQAVSTSATLPTHRSRWSLPGSRSTVSSTMSIRSLDSMNSVPLAEFNSKFLTKLRDGSKKSTQIILAWMRNPKISTQFDRESLNTALHILSKNFPPKKYDGRWLETLEALLVCAPDRLDIEYRHPPDIDFTPLMWAVWYKHHEVVDRLLKAGANIGTVDRYFQRTPLLWAAKRDSWRASIVLLNSMEVREYHINTKDKDGKTALAIATAERHAQTVKVLQSAGAGMGEIIGSDTQHAAELGQFSRD